MSQITKEDFLNLTSIALLDKKINNYEFRILFYIYQNSDFMVSKLKEDLNISSFNMISKFIKNLVKNGYINKVSKGRKCEKNESVYNYFINANKLQLQNNNNNTKDSDYFTSWDLYYYFFEKIPTSRKIDKAINVKQLNLLITLDNYEVDYIKNLIDFVSTDETLKAICSRPTTFRKNIDLIIKTNKTKKILISA